MFHDRSDSSLLRFATRADVLPQVFFAASAVPITPLLPQWLCHVGTCKKYMIGACRCKILVNGMRQRVIVKQAKVRTQMQKTGKHMNQL